MKIYTGLFYNSIVGFSVACAELEITVDHRPFSDQFQDLTDKTDMLGQFTVYFQWGIQWFVSTFDKWLANL